ncbi:glutathione S-transferase family protein [Polymorphum gilvum]|uniref:Glutathione S-transferase family protein n=1 Tax=Polymorphum gilvum (strain LMG 25793 / CGMCC 1.9160 / SL003B-26A1) TaxID=991905 RepID=F2IZB7_POLGS|nr:glutathione S-transferase family protein [Polymorphum gilvum]ADZ68540.1 Glutathione S-transferase family protein [Polymorphum gilvum SL003B-26A1]
MYTVIGTPRSRANRVIWILEELGEPYDLVPALPQSEEIRALNPAGKVPALLVDGAVLTDSVAIVQFLADRHGRFTFPAGTIERARQDSFTQFCVDEIEGALWTAAKNSLFHPEEIRVPAIKDVCRMEFDTALKTLEARLGEGPYVMGAEFTVPDLLFGQCAGWAAAAKFDLPKEGALHAYFKRLRERPAYRALMQKVAEAA